jgi:hypothetical protein
MTDGEKSFAQKVADDFIERNKDALDRLARDGKEDNTGCQSVDDKNEDSDNALTGGEDDNL